MSFLSALFGSRRPKMYDYHWTLTDNHGKVWSGVKTACHPDTAKAHISCDLGDAGCEWPRYEHLEGGCMLEIDIVKTVPCAAP